MKVHDVMIHKHRVWEGPKSRADPRRVPLGQEVECVQWNVRKSQGPAPVGHM